MEVPSLNKFDTRDLVIKLHNEGKTYKEIASIAHVSIRDIKPIIKKYERRLRSEIRTGEDNQAKPIKKISKSSNLLTIVRRKNASRSCN